MHGTRDAREKECLMPGRRMLKTLSVAEIQEFQSARRVLLGNFHMARLRKKHSLTYLCFGAA
jgi:hypothetical protein